MKTKILVLSGLLILSTISCGSRSNTNTNDVAANHNSSIVETTTNNNTVVEVSAEGKAIHLTKDMFLKQVMDYENNPETWNYLGDKPAIIDFYADWCRPCKITSPIMDELAKEYAGEVIIYKINTEHERELSSVFGIRSIPTFLFIPTEGKPYMSSGIAPTPAETKQMFIDQIDKYLLNNSEQTL